MFLLPSVILLLGVYFVPIIDVIRLAFSEAHMLQGVTGWVGLENFKSLMNKDFYSSIIKTFIWLVSTVFISLIIGLCIALLLNKPIKGRSFFRVITILPWLFPEALIATMWLWTVHPHHGFINNLLINLGIINESINFLSADLALTTIIVIRIWRDIPFVVMVLLAGLQSIPRELEEAAEIDGANGFQKIWYITLPLLKPIIITSMIILSAWTLIIFDMVYIMTGGGPNKATQILSVLMYETAFTRFDFGLTSAMAVLTLILVSILAVLYLKSQRSDDSINK